MHVVESLVESDIFQTYNCNSPISTANFNDYNFSFMALFPYHNTSLERYQRDISNDTSFMDYH